MATAIKNVAEQDLLVNHNQFEDAAHLRAIGISAGDLRNAALHEIAKIMREHKNNQVIALQIGVDRLLQAGHISNSEADDLKRVVRLVLGATRQKSEPSQTASEVREIYERMVVSEKSSPVALAVASAANSAFSSSPENGVSTTQATVTITPNSTGAGAVIGGIIGGIFGGLMGGPAGAALGAAAGAAAGAGIGFCNQHGI
jgi:hypothetical protein